MAAQIAAVESDLQKAALDRQAKAVAAVEARADAKVKRLEEEIVLLERRLAEQSNCMHPKVVVTMQRSLVPRRWPSAKPALRTRSTP